MPALSAAEVAAIATALAEDCARDDVTTAAVVPSKAQGAAEIRAKAPGVVAGLAVAGEVFRQVDAQVRFTALAADGDRVEAGRAVARVEGSLVSLLTGERVAVNFLQRMSGIATLTGQFVQAVRGTGVIILATRKTAPGLRPFDLGAVRAGGGRVHRESLGEQILVKENHVRAARLAGTARSMDEVVARTIAAARAAAAPARPRALRVGIEAADLDEVRAALVPGVDLVLLDNFTPSRCREAIELRAERLRAGVLSHPAAFPELEASGGITLANVAAYAATGVERISVGALTHSAPALDLSMKVLG